MNPKLERRIFLGLHALIAVCILLFPLYRQMTNVFPIWMTGCVLHDCLFLYCVGCGGTRAVSSLLHFRLLDALQYNAAVTLGILIALGLDAGAWVRFWKRKTPLIRIHPAVWIVMAVLIAVYFILRNYLMIVHGIDPIGDLGWFWEGFREKLREILQQKGF